MLHCLECWHGYYLEAWTQPPPRLRLNQLPPAQPPPLCWTFANNAVHAPLPTSRLLLASGQSIPLAALPCLCMRSRRQLHFIFRWHTCSVQLCQSVSQIALSRGCVSWQLKGAAVPPCQASARFRHTATLSHSCATLARRRGQIRAVLSRRAPCWPLELASA